MSAKKTASSSRLRTCSCPKRYRYSELNFHGISVASSVIYDTMDRKRLGRIRRTLAALRRGQPKAKEFQSVAGQLGRKSVKRGKEPMHESDPFPHLRPLSIPNHKGRDMAKGTRDSILNQLEEDADAWEERIDRQEQGNGGRNRSGG